tara:strand:+ start:397 stop:987 length:591 start_codon:yes stop_codon:yes gene_type:complete
MNRRKIGRFIYYFLGVLLPFLISPFFTAFCDPRQDGLLFIFLSIGFLSHWIARKLAFNFKLINEEKFTSLTFLGSIFLWLSIAFVIACGSIRCPDYSYSIKNTLILGIKECVIRDADNQTTNFSDSDSFSDKYSDNYNYGGFKIEPIDPKSCYRAKAVSKNETYTWFEIEMDEDTGAVTKTCGDSSKIGCDEGNTW